MIHQQTLNYAYKCSFALNIAVGIIMVCTFYRLCSTTFIESSRQDAISVTHLNLFPSVYWHAFTKPYSLSLILFIFSAFVRDCTLASFSNLLILLSKILNWVLTIHTTYNLRISTLIKWICKYVLRKNATGFFFQMNNKYWENIASHL